MPAEVESTQPNDDEIKQKMDIQEEKQEKQKSPREERNVIKKFHGAQLKEGELWYPVSFKWWKMWCDYTNFNAKDDELPDGDWEGVRPPEIDNSELQDEEHPLSIKRDVEEGLHFVLVHREVWGRLSQWYGGGPVFDRKVIVQGGGGLQKTKTVDLYPVYVSYCWVDNSTKDGSPDLTNIQPLAVPRSKTFQDVVEKFIKDETDSKNRDPDIRVWYQAEAKQKPDIAETEDGNGDNTTEQPVAENGVVDSEPEASQSSGDTELNGVGEKSGTLHAGAKAGHEWKLARSSELEKPMEAWGLPKGELLMFEKKPTGHKNWTRNAIKQDWEDFEVGDVLDVKDNAKKWYQSDVLDVKEDKSQIFVHYIGWPSKWNEWVATDETVGRVAKQYTHTVGPRKQTSRSTYTTSSSWSWSSNEKGAPLERGAVGLRNLGNTCFMNSTIQCLSSTPRLTKYFLDGVYKKDINPTNPLGRGGKIAEEWGELIKDLWSGSYKIVAPRKLKDEIGKFAPRFLGYQQQDSSELLSFLLDGLHEDLNRIVEKPVTEAKESDGRPDKTVASESWETYRKRNDSVIVDYMQGQLKSKVVCPTCDRISITFDPYMFLSVPLPTVKDKVQKVTLVCADAKKKPCVFGPKVEKLGAISSLKKALGDLAGVNPNHLVVCDIWNNRVYRFIKDGANISEIRPNDHIFVYEVPPNEEEQSENKADDDSANIQVFNSKLEENPHYHPNSTYSKEFIMKEFGIPVVVNLPLKKEVTHRQIREHIRSATSPFVVPSNDETDPYDIRMMDRTGRACLVCSYSRSCDGCELPDDDKPFDLKEGKVVFCLSWKDTERYNDVLDNIERHDSAPPDTDRSYGASKAAPVDLAACIDCFTAEETLTEQNAWYCSQCKEFRCATKKMDLWSAPDILVIHLKRFQYTRAFRDKINTLVKFPLKNLDLSAWIVNGEDGEALYDLYAVSNHMGGLGGGHYTAYAENLQDSRWYNLDDSHVSPMSNPSDCVSSSAYVLYYKRVGMSNDVLPSTDEVEEEEEIVHAAPSVATV